MSRKKTKNYHAQRTNHHLKRNISLWHHQILGIERVNRPLRSLSPEIIGNFSNEDNCWFETDEEKELMLEWGRKKRKLISWLRKKMKRRLTQSELYYIEMHFFQGKTYREIGKECGKSPSSICRSIRRSMHKLKTLSQKHPDYALDKKTHLKEGK